MSSKRLTKEEFEAFIHALLANDPLKVKYQKPDAWRRYPNKNE